MRSSSLLDALINRTRQRILGATMLQPNRSWYLLELARHLQLRPSSLQRELRQLTGAGILKRYQNGNRVYFQANTECPVFSELVQLLIKTVGVVEVLRDALQPLSKAIDLAFVYGSVAASKEGAASDIDLMIIGAAPLSEVAPLAREAEKRIGRAVNPTVYGPEDFIRQLNRKNHFLTTVVQKDAPVIFIKGGPGELAELIASATNQTASHEHSGTERFARRRRA